MFSQQEIEHSAKDLLARNLDPGPRVRLLRDVLGVSPKDERLRQAQRDLQQNVEANEIKTVGLDLSMLVNQNEQREVVGKD